MPTAFTKPSASTLDDFSTYVSLTATETTLKNNISRGIDTIIVNETATSGDLALFHEVTCGADGTFGNDTWPPCNTHCEIPYAAQRCVKKWCPPTW